MTLLDKVIDGYVCCALEAEEGIGCMRDCPYSKHGYQTATCRNELRADDHALRELLEYNAKAKLNDLLQEKENLERELKTITALNTLRQENGGLVKNERQ